VGIIERIKKLNLTEDTKVTMSYENGCDVFVHNETAVETALTDTDVISTLAELIVEYPKLNVSLEGSNNSILSAIRTQGLLNNYERGIFDFEDFVANTITENFYDQDYVESSVKAFDYKRGWCTLSTEVQTTVGEFLSESPVISSNWTVSVPTENGVLTFD
jgi:hypothetical protein